MAGTTNRNPARRVPETSSLLGLVDFRPRITVVLVFLTIMVAVFGWRFTRDAGVRRIDALAREAVGILAAAPPGKDGTGVPDPSEAEKRVRELSGVTLDLPRDDAEFVLTGVSRETFGKRPAEAVRFRYGGNAFRLLVFRQERLLGGEAPAAFPEESFLSGEREGKSYVFWEREGASYIMVSDADVTRAFDLVRRLFT